jgi:ribosome-binding protein aMBF1 (putative translation factor)
MEWRFLKEGKPQKCHDTYPSGECVARRKRGCSGQQNKRDSGACHPTRRNAKERTTMKEKPNYAELEKRIDFTMLAGRLGQLTEQDNPKRKTVFTLLDKVREQILAARRTRNVSYQVLARELTGAGLTVSEPTLRKYIRAQTGAKKPRNKVVPETGSGGGKPAAPAASAETKPAASGKQHR